MPRKSWSAVGLVMTVAILVGAAWADRPNASPEELRQASTAIVTGKVKCIYSSTERKEAWETTKFVAEVAVARCEKGDIKPGGLVYARYYSQRALGKGLTAPGYSGITESTLNREWGNLSGSISRRRRANHLIGSPMAASTSSVPTGANC